MYLAKSYLSVFQTTFFEWHLLCEDVAYAPLDLELAHSQVHNSQGCGFYLVCPEWNQLCLHHTLEHVEKEWNELRQGQHYVWCEGLFPYLNHLLT